MAGPEKKTTFFGGLAEGGLADRKVGKSEFS